MNLPGYSPDFNAGEAIWGWAKEEATGNLCLGSKAAIQQRVGNFLTCQPEGRGETPLPNRPVIEAERLARASQSDLGRTPTAHPTLPWLWFRRCLGA